MSQVDLNLTPHSWSTTKSSFEKHDHRKSVVYTSNLTSSGEDWFPIEINRLVWGLCWAGGIECDQLRGHHHHHQQWQKTEYWDWITFQVIRLSIAKLYPLIIIVITVWINRGDLWWTINWEFLRASCYLSPSSSTLVTNYKNTNIRQI